MFNNSQVLSDIEMIYETQDFSINLKHQNLAKMFLDELESGKIRCAYKNNNTWQVDIRVKKAILFCFKQGVNKKVKIDIFSYIDKDNLWPQDIALDKQTRIVPGGSSVRRGAFIGNNVTLMPPCFVNIGAFIDDKSMLDSNALVGSCAQIGKNVHISAGAQIGGVLEPIGAMPVIIEDNVLIGANSGVFEGTIVREQAIIAAGVNLTKGMKVFDLVNQVIIQAKDVLEIPQRAVVVPGSRPILNNDFAKKHNLAISCPIIVKYRDEHTDAKSMLEEFLRA